MNEWEKDQAEVLRKRARKEKVEPQRSEVDPLSLPPRKEVHKKPKKYKRRPSLVVHLLFYLFILLIGMAIGIGIWMYWSS